MSLFIMCATFSRETSVVVIVSYIALIKFKDRDYKKDTSITFLSYDIINNT